MFRIYHIQHEPCGKFTQTIVVTVIVKSGGGGHEKAKSPSCLHGRERSVQLSHLQKL